MNTLFEAFLNNKGFVILDGAMATELEARGANLNHSLWSAKLLTENPELIKQVHIDYLLAGADVITTASYQASFEGFAKHGYTRDQAIHLIQLSVQMAKEARDQANQLANRTIQPLIAASVGPYGASLADGSEYRGNYGVSIETLKSFHRERMAILLEAKPELLACETIPCIDEAIALCEVLAEFPEAKAWISFSCKDAEHICSGENFADVVNIINASEQIIAVGVNCTAPQYVASLIKIGAANTNKLLLAYPNKGEVYDATNKVWLANENKCSSFLDDAKTWFNNGARLIGGCCRTNPADIAGLTQISITTI